MLGLLSVLACSSVAACSLSWRNFGFATLLGVGVGFVFASGLVARHSTLYPLTVSDAAPFAWLPVLVTGTSPALPLTDCWFVGLDGLSLALVWLTVFIALLCVLYNHHAIGFASPKYGVLVVAVTAVLCACFAVKSLLGFYVFFEAVLIPMFLLIGMGSRGRKVHANYLFFFFTFASSIPTLLGIALTYANVGSLSFLAFPLADLSPALNLAICALFFVGFAAKIPLLPLHVWLPEAHVEAPTVGSVILAAILLKLGAYGMVRVVLPFYSPAIFAVATRWVVPLLLLSVLLPAFVAVRQSDLKRVVAYSSVVHMGFALLGLFSHSSLGLRGFFFLLLSHGFISAGLFFCVGMIYDRFHTRNLLYYGGLVQYMPLFTMVFFVLVFSNLSLPSTCNFVGEFVVLYAIYDGFGLGAVVFSLVGLFATVLFCLVLLARVCFYQVTGLFTVNLVDLTAFELLVLAPLLVYVLWFGLVPNGLFGLLGAL